MNYEQIIKQELDSLYGESVLNDMNEIIKLYDFYEGTGQKWVTPPDLDYSPTKVRTNITRKLIDKESSFMFDREPLIKLSPSNKDDIDEVQKIQKYIKKILKKNNFSKKLVDGAKDCFIGKRVALKLYASKDEGIKIMFKSSPEFVYETDIDDIDRLNKIIFFFQLNDENDKAKQQIWKQKFELNGNGKCILNEGIYNGYGNIIKVIEENKDTGLDFIPAYVIVNEGLTGDPLGRSDISEDLMEGQNIYNKLKSDDVDALKFNMFPQKVFKNCNQKTFENLKIAPSAIIDAQAETEKGDVDVRNLESNFTYNDRLENTLKRIKQDMYGILSIPSIDQENLEGLLQSSKSMKALYWDLISRTQTKFNSWRPGLEWLIDSIIKLTKIYKLETLPEVEYTTEITLRHSILEDEETERMNDLKEVDSQARSRRSYIKKWGIDEDANAEMQRIVEEQRMLEEQFIQQVTELGDE